LNRGIASVSLAAGEAVLAATCGLVLALSLALPLGHWLVYVALVVLIPVLIGVGSARWLGALGFAAGGISAATGVAVISGFRTAGADGNDIGAGNAFWEGVLIGGLPGLVAVSVAALLSRARRRFYDGNP
jgi:hypothetical protein